MATSKILVPSSRFEDKHKQHVENLFRSNTKLYESASKLKAGKSSLLDLPDDFSAQDLIIEDGRFDLTRMMKKAIDPVTGLPNNIKLEEGDFKEARNYFHFCNKFLGEDSYLPYARQMWIILKLLGDFCPKCSDPKWMNMDNVPVDYKTVDMPEHLQMMKYGVCPKCKTRKYDFYKQGLMPIYTEMALEAGQRSGKSTITTSLAAYVTHKYLKYPKISLLAKGIQNSTTLSATFVGYRFTDAVALLWQPLMEVMAGSPWYQQYMVMLDDAHEKYGIEFYRKKDMYLRFAHKGIALYPEGPNKRALRGRTRYFGATDEIGWFPLDDEDRERAGAKEVHKALDRSLGTLRQEVEMLYKEGYDHIVTGINAMISSPSSQMDFIHTTVQQHKNGSTKTLAVQLPTWEINPRFPRDSTTIEDAYRENAVAAERDWGANPPLNSAMFIDTSDHNVQACFKTTNRATVARIVANRNGKLQLAGQLQLVSPMTPTPPSILALDAGATNNSFAITVMHMVGKANITVDVLLEIAPKAKETINFDQIYTRILETLIIRFNVKMIFSDRWDSRALLYRAQEELNVEQAQYSVKYPDFTTFRSYLMHRQIELPKLEMTPLEIGSIIEWKTAFVGKPMSHLFHQFLTVRDHGSTVTKGEGFTDDMFRALVLGTSRLSDPKIKEKMELHASLMNKQQHKIGAVSAGRSLGQMSLPGYIQQPNAYRGNQTLTEAGKALVSTPDNANRLSDVVVRISGSSSVGFPTKGGS